ncbi:hypothetical protein BV25DRAFT_1438713 [Artomyces pyxidatus]|uniref:Uncharacterized protein n=1 Tax=Artomyces pyxidatus TaxID=48021 RepID=A0ACB8SNE8_9AGAM|nr:hypothetical protein BV25DRAFT_1438713 [Artomyces pyxidatus]
MSWRFSCALFLLANSSSADTVRRVTCPVRGHGRAGFSAVRIQSKVFPEDPAMRIFCYPPRRPSCRVHIPPDIVISSCPAGRSMIINCSSGGGVHETFPADTVTRTLQRPLGIRLVPLFAFMWSSLLAVAKSCVTVILNKPVSCEVSSQDVPRKHHEYPPAPQA